MVKARPVMRKRWSRGLMPRHWPEIPRRSRASLKEVVSSRAARATFLSLSIRFEHVFVVGAHYLRNGSAAANRLRHGFFARQDSLGGIEDAGDFRGGDEGHPARVSDDVI